MNKQLIVFYLKRHVIGIVGLVLAIAFGVSGFLMMGKAKDAIDAVETDFIAKKDQRSNLEKGQALGGSQGVKVDSKNVDAADDEAEIHRTFIKNAGEVIREDTIDPMGSEEFMVYMANVLDEMNQRAREALVQVQRDSTNATIRIPYNFTFMNLRSVPVIAKNRIPELQVQLKDIRTSSGVLFRSRVRSIESFQRTRVTIEDLMAGGSRDFLDNRSKYTNNVSVVRPYRVSFKCLSGGIAKTLNGFASEKNFVVIRKMEVTQMANQASPAGGFGFGGGMGGFPGVGGSAIAGGFFGEEDDDMDDGSGAGFGVGVTGSPPKKALTPAQLAWLVRYGFTTTKATNVISESVLKVELDLDVIRKLPGEPDPNEGAEPVPTTTPQPEQPPPPGTPPGT
jgi:hypothetical protein